MKEPKFKIGDTLYIATFNSTDNYIICPDCGGTKTLRVILWDGTEYIIDCQGCSAGYDPPIGYIRTYKRIPKVEVVTLSGMEINQNSPIEYRVRWSSYCYRTLKEDELFVLKEDAEAKAVVTAKELEEKELAEIEQKEKPTRSWAWHVHYHRKQIRDAEETIARATDQLNVAKRHIKAEPPRAGNSGEKKEVKI